MMQSNSQDSQVTSCETKLGRAMDEHARNEPTVVKLQGEQNSARKAFLPRKLPDRALCWATPINT